MQVSAISALSLNAPSVPPQPAARTAAKSASPAQAAPTGNQAALGAAPALVEAIYTTRVGGHDYVGDVSYASGVYTIAVPGLPGAVVAAPSLIAAENALTARIDVLA